MDYVIGAKGLQPLGTSKPDPRWEARDSDPEHIAAIRTIVRNHTAARVKCPVTRRRVGVDAFSASALVQVFDALKSENRAKLAAMQIGQAVAVAFRTIAKATS